MSTELIIRHSLDAAIHAAVEQGRADMDAAVAEGGSAPMLLFAQADAYRNEVESTALVIAQAYRDGVRREFVDSESTRISAWNFFKVKEAEELIRCAG